MTCGRPCHFRSDLLECSASYRFPAGNSAVRCDERRLSLRVGVLYPETKRGEDEPMLTEEQVHTAVAKGIAFLTRSREPYGLWFMSMMHRLFGVPEFADALKRYDEVIATPPQEEAGGLRVLRRLTDANNPIQTEDWDHVKILTDQLLACALYCDRLRVSPGVRGRAPQRGEESGV